MCSSQSWLKSLPCSFYISIVFCIASGFNFVAGQNAGAITPVCQLPIAAPTSSPSASYTSELKGTVLNVTNFYRQQHNASLLTWNDTLANYAQNWTNGCQWEDSVGDFSFYYIIRALRKLLCSSL